MTEIRKIDYFDEVAALWLAAERLHNSALDAEMRDPTQSGDGFMAHLSVARDRAIAVVSGEVKWSEASPADRAVWSSRARMPAMVLLNEEREREEVERAAPIHMRGKVRKDDRSQIYWNYWDTLVFDDRLQRTTRMFGWQHIGDTRRTNMQVQNMLASGNSFRALNFYARIQWPAPDDAMPWNAVFTFMVSQSPWAQGKLRDLLVGIPCDVIIPPRAEFSVVAESYDALQRLGVRAPALEIEIHLEGVLSRSID